MTDRQKKQRRGSIDKRPAIETDPVRVKRLAMAREDAHWELRRKLKDGALSESAVDERFHRLFDAVSQEIDCKQCGNCCIEQKPVLDAADVKRVSRRLNVLESDFEKKYLKKSDDGEGLEFVQSPCPMLNGKLCSVYDDRPQVCRSYPHLHQKERLWHLAGVLQNAQICPIVFVVLERFAEEMPRGRRR
jgi:Fe-S-cluster containining protein